MVSELRARHEAAPTDAIFMVRGGVMDPEDLRRAASLCHERYGVYGISILRADQESDIDALAKGRLRRYEFLTVTTTGNLRTAGLDPAATFHRPHYTIVLADLDAAIGAIVTCPSEVRRNPYFQFIGPGILTDKEE